MKKRLLLIILTLSVILGTLPFGCVTASGNENVNNDNKDQRRVYIHAQQTENPTETTNVSTVYSGETADIYFAVDNPNKGKYNKNGKTDSEKHEEPEYDMGGYTVTICYDPNYFELSKYSDTPFVYNLPDKNISTSDKKDDENLGDDTASDVPDEIGYYIYEPGTGEKYVGGTKYKTAYITVFFNGCYIPQKQGEGWYDLCKLPLKVKSGRTGSTQVFIDTAGVDDEDVKTLQLFAKNKSDNLKDQTFEYKTVNGGYHNIIIKDKSRPEPLTANPPAGSYTEAQSVTLTAESDCDIYILDGEKEDLYDGHPIDVSISQTITCYAKRRDNGKKSNTVTFDYRILPKAPFVFVDKDGTKQLIQNVYSQTGEYKVYISDKAIYGNIDPENIIYYTLSDDPGLSTDNMKVVSDPYKGWVKLEENGDRAVDITKKTKLRLVTKKIEEFSNIAEYTLGIKPNVPYTTKASGEYATKVEVPLLCDFEGAEIYYTTDGTDLKANGILYDGDIIVAKDTTIRAVAKFEGFYSDVVSYHYIITDKDENGVDAFYPSGIYEGDVTVTLTPFDPDKDVVYSIDGGAYKPYTEPISVDKDTVIKAKAGKDNVFGEEYTFTYKIKPMAPVFAPETAQFTGGGKVAIYTPESRRGTEDNFELYYTIDGSDPKTSKTAKKAEGAFDSVELKVNKNCVIKAVVLKNGKTYSDTAEHTYSLLSQKSPKPEVTLKPGNYIRKIGDEAVKTQFMPQVDDIYYTISTDGTYKEDPPTATETVSYKGVEEVEIKGHTIIKAAGVNVFGINGDVAVFDYTVTPEAPKAPSSATISGSELPVIPVSAVKGSKIMYDINGVKCEFVSADGEFYINTKNGNAYKDKDCTQSLLDNENTSTFTDLVKIDIEAELDGIKSGVNSYTYKLTNDNDFLAPPYSDKASGKYEEAAVDSDDNLMHISLNSLNSGNDVTVEYKLNGGSWTDYTGESVKIKEDTVLFARCKNGNGVKSDSVTYVYNFVPLAPVITVESGRYSIDSDIKIKLKYNDAAPTDKKETDYVIMHRFINDTKESPYSDGMEYNISDMTSEMENPYKGTSLNAYVLNTEMEKVSKNNIKYYIIESEEISSNKVYVKEPYNVSSIKASLLSTGEYAEGIKLASYNKNAKIHYYYGYKLKKGNGVDQTSEYVYDSPITVNPAMTEITITAWLTIGDNEIPGSRIEHRIEFTGSTGSGGGGGGSVSGIGGGGQTVDNTRKYTKDIFGTEHPTHISYINGYPDGSVQPEGEITREEMTAILYRITNHEYEKPFIATGDAFPDVSEDMWSAHDIEYMADKNVVNGYPDGEFKPQNNLTRAEFAALICRFTGLDKAKEDKAEKSDKLNNSKKPFSDLSDKHWAYDNILSLSDAEIVNGYEDNTFRPENDITRGEVMTVINKILGRNPLETYVKSLDFNPYIDLDKDKWYYTAVLEATVTHDYWLDDNGFEKKWENCK